MENQKEMIIMCITEQRRGWEESVVCNQRWWETKSGKGECERTSSSGVSRSDFENARISFNNKEVITDEPLCKFFVEPKPSAWNKSLKWNTEDSLVFCLDVIHVEVVTTTEMEEMKQREKQRDSTSAEMRELHNHFSSSSQRRVRPFHFKESEQSLLSDLVVCKLFTGIHVMLVMLTS